MAEQDERPRPHGDPLEEVVAQNPEDNQAQAGSDAPADVTGDPGDDRSNNSDRAEGRGSDANGVPAFDESDGDARKKLYEKGAVLVSRID
ncbi:MAG: hypothetical protein V7647_1900 [Acidobacteriota bacterium]|jgi:hypothetical protein